MQTENTTKVLSSRQVHALRLIADGTPHRLAASKAGYSRAHLSKLATSPAGRVELMRLREAAAQRLAEALPHVIEVAVEVLRQDLLSSNLAIRREAARWALKTFGVPLLGDAQPDPLAGLITTGELSHPGDAERIRQDSDPAPSPAAQDDAIPPQMTLRRPSDPAQKPAQWPPDDACGVA